MITLKKDILEENIIQEFRLKNIHETRNYFIEQINEIDLMSKKHVEVSKGLNYTECLLIFASEVIGVSISTIASLNGVSIGIVSSAEGLKICAIFAGVKKYRSLIKQGKRAMIKYYCWQKLSSIT